MFVVWSMRINSHFLRVVCEQSIDFRLQNQRVYRKKYEHMSNMDRNNVCLLCSIKMLSDNLFLGANRSGLRLTELLVHANNEENVRTFTKNQLHFSYEVWFLIF